MTPPRPFRPLPWRRRQAALSRLLVAAALAAGFGTVTVAQDDGDEAWLPLAPAFKGAGVRTSCAASTGMDPETASDKKLREAYACALESMVPAYAASGDGRAERYATWTNYALTPYVSATHAGRYSSNYANEIASAYGRYEDAGALPVGSVIAKDSFTVARNGRVEFGPLFLMEKRAPEASPETGGWIFTMIMPTGWVFGETRGVGSDNVGFCADCHRAVAKDQDYLYFLPVGVRRQAP